MLPFQSVGGTIMPRGWSFPPHRHKKTKQGVAKPAIKAYRKRQRLARRLNRT